MFSLKFYCSFCCSFSVRFFCCRVVFSEHDVHFTVGLCFSLVGLFCLLSLNGGGAVVHKRTLNNESSNGHCKVLAKLTVPSGAWAACLGDVFGYRAVILWRSGVFEARQGCQMWIFLRCGRPSGEAVLRSVLQHLSEVASIEPEKSIYLWFIKCLRHVCGTEFQKYLNSLCSLWHVGIPPRIPLPPPHSPKLGVEMSFPLQDLLLVLGLGVPLFHSVSAWSAQAVLY